MTTNLEALRILAEKATQGKWASKPSAHSNRFRYVRIGNDENYTTLELEPGDARYIAAANPQTMLSLLSRLQVAEAELDQMKTGVAEVYQAFGVMADAGGFFDHPDVNKVMDWLADPSAPLDILPWPKTPLRSTDTSGVKP